jgi:hypothetical protein
MSNASETKYQPNCMLAHDLINRLSIIVGYCDLLADEGPENSMCHERLLMIRQTANAAAEDLAQHQCQLETLARQTAAACLVQL